jgi:hypothetical protein
MMTGVELRAGVTGMLSVESSGFEPLLRAESAAKGETTDLDCALVVFRFSVTREGLPGVGFEVAAAGIPASLSSCSMGNRRWACDIFSNPNSR